SDSSKGEIDLANTIGLSITDAKHDCDDTLTSVTLTGVSDGWSLSGDGAASVSGDTWTASAASLTALSRVAPPGAEGTVVTLGVTAGATEAGATGTATTSASLPDTVSQAPDAPLPSTSDSSKGEIDLANTIGLSITDAK